MSSTNLLEALQRELFDMRMQGICRSLADSLLVGLKIRAERKELVAVLAKPGTRNNREAIAAWIRQELEGDPDCTTSHNLCYELAKRLRAVLRRHQEDME